MSKYVCAYLGTLLVFLALDAVWLGWVASSFYKSAIGHLMADEPRLGVALVFYLLFVAGLTYFAIAPALRDGDWRMALGRGAMFGFMAYMTYDLSNYATLRGWPARLVLVDVAWGTLLGGVSTVLGYLAAVTLIKT